MIQRSFFPNSEGYPVLCFYLHFYLVDMMIIIKETYTEVIK